MSNPLQVFEGDASGLFAMHDQEGFPLADSLLQCKLRGWSVNWPDYYAAAHAAGWSFRKTSRMVAEAIRDADWHDTIEGVYRSVFSRVL